MLPSSFFFFFYIYSQVMLDTLMLAGTNPSLMIVQEMILDGRVAGEMAVQAVAALVPTIETPTRELLAKLMVRTAQLLLLSDALALALAGLASIFTFASLVRRTVGHLPIGCGHRPPPTEDHHGLVPVSLGLPGLHPQ